MIRWFLVLTALSTVPNLVQGESGGKSGGKQGKKPNILFIAIDDLNDWVGCLGGHPQVKTPHMDGLARRGTLFANAHCQSPLCNPSRASLLTGRRPSSTGIYGLAPGIRQVAATRAAVTLPQYLSRNGWFTLSFGKVFHDGSIPPKQRPAEFDVWGPAPGMPRPAKPFVQTPGKHPLVDWGIFPEDDRQQADWKIADAALERLRKMPKDRPFFLSVGFRLPHVPCYASKKWFDLYPEKAVQLPPVLENDRADTPEFSWYLHWKLPEPRLSWAKRSGQWRPMVRSYLATISFVDSQVGRLLQALEEEGLLENTIVVLFSDHGYHLGEKAVTGKNTLWERSTRVPLIFAGPGIDPGGKCTQPAELLDIYPTLIELCGLPPRKDLEGHSLVAQLRDAKAQRPWPAITTHNQGNHAVRSERWRYIRYADGTEELYDMAKDPNEWHNLAKRPEFAQVRQDHVRWLPKVDLPPAPGSAHRVLSREGDRWLWEGRPIVPDEKEE